MSKVVFTMKLEPELREQFMAEAAAGHDEYVHRKMEVARAQLDAGLYVSNEEVEKEAAARRKELLRRVGASE